VETNLVRGERRRYELEAMRAYKPDLRSRAECLEEITARPLRGLVTKVIYDLNPYNKDIAKQIELKVHFSPKLDTFRQQLFAELTKAKKYLFYLDQAATYMDGQEKLRNQDGSYRWQANYDLIRAQLPAYTVRTYEYMAYLNQFVRAPKQVPLTKSPWYRHPRSCKHRVASNFIQPFPRC
jgi:hypothetical protein